jgi:hypothetical protein
MTGILYSQEIFLKQYKNLKIKKLTVQMVMRFLLKDKYHKNNFHKLPNNLGSFLKSKYFKIREKDPYC